MSDESARDQVLNKVTNVVHKIANEIVPQHGKSVVQTVTVAVPAQRIEQFWRDPDQLSVVLGDIADVESLGDERYRWQLRKGPDVCWDSAMATEPGCVRYTGTDDQNEILVSYRSAPNDLGTEVTLSISAAAPGLLSGAAAYKVLYRLRALLQTGEVPTIKSNPSARASAR